MKIGELAQSTACSVETIRYYEQQGLLPEPRRTEGNYRDYGMAHQERLRFIRNCRSLDMAHEEIRALLRHLDSPEGDCGGVNSVIDEHLAHVRRRMAELSVLEHQLSSLRRKCDRVQSAAECGILHDLGDGVVRSGRAQSHLAGTADVH